MAQIISGKTFDAERALYNLTDATVANCRFAGPADGESALKESRGVTIKDCSFSLRYPLWHSHGFTLCDSTLDGATRAPIWYAEDGFIDGCTIDGVKCLRECSRIGLRASEIRSPEFGWRCREVSLTDCSVESEYFLFEATDVTIERLNMKGKYSFQYVKGMTIEDSVLDTKDAFWHSSGVTVRDSVVKGEYLGWYSDGLTLINCRIIGTQPLCYCTGLRLIGCRMESTDLAFEYSEVEADVIGRIDSVKNPRSGSVVADDIGQIITGDAIMSSTCAISVRNGRGGEN